MAFPPDLFVTRNSANVSPPRSLHGRRLPTSKRRLNVFQIEYVPPDTKGELIFALTPERVASSY